MRREKAAVAATLLSPVLAASAAGLQGTVQGTSPFARPANQPLQETNLYVCLNWRLADASRTGDRSVAATV
jgi:hypothetical protein